MADSEFGSEDAGAVQACLETPEHWLEIELIDEDGFPVAYEEYLVTLADGSVVGGFLDAEGFERFVTDTPGNCIVSFPKLDKKAWHYKTAAGPKAPPIL